ncbi:flagellar basal body rod protein FlgC [Paludibaculum fermentans]|uniref:flagellar basal body rod protein FlgC n=1 Tax=Paludibaculum fermentans TaxID=1473598 RepID=UPI003EBDBD74
MSLFNLLSVSASGMAAQRARAEVIVENLANSETTRTPEGGPYRRKDVVFESEAQGSPFSAVFQAEMSAGSMGVGVSQVIEDSRPPDMRYQPGHPHADARGYVAFPHMSPAEEMVDLMGATRGYQANVAAISAVKDMVSKSIELMK